MYHGERFCFAGRLSLLLRQTYMNYLCREWNLKHGGGEEALEKIEIFVMKEQAIGKSNPDLTKRIDFPGLTCQ